MIAFSYAIGFIFQKANSAYKMYWLLFLTISWLLPFIFVESARSYSYFYTGYEYNNYSSFTKKTMSLITLPYAVSYYYFEGFLSISEDTNIIGNNFLITFLFQLI